ncbi:putative transcription factor homeobox-WOX family [Helianthus annuus]|uniref:Transcription factor HB-HD-ZIP family n=1 Tax=Helianthus annuus TaxID=4232 RepID=A0A9K3HWX0_HELAN|nr:homeobox-leucine zipper protein HAT14 [Helianthus annuus]KAF5785774.1 putative transcription factor HB-HD-ZIP family [Helianthus annuus]KAJ0513288.1 putative transcription factor homeobox-WOX family [Helianthus annuus]KAJ0521073.1 putative transcription factor homeobox-WOX family [Helianthus annuus]KAJ0529402.1 putative transcription factor homeobox-WOX family [Helianthus annuus]KAJ0696288.1 putative transcription factor homeobox-WOX family [Helianthus annuus]
MELALSLGDTPKPISIADENRSQQQKNKELGFCMVLGSSSQVQDHQHKNYDDDDKTNCSSSSSDPRPLQLDLRPFSPSLHQSSPTPPPSHRPFPWLSQILIGEPSSHTKLGKGLDVKPLTAVYDPDNGEEPAPVQSSPNDSNSDTSSFQMDFSSIFRSSAGSSRFPSMKPDMEFVRGNMDFLADVSERDHRVSSRRGGYGGTSDDDENGLGRKKLRLTKEQSAFLEDSFKEHNTLNPKQKLILANQLNLRPRQVEVWFQNRRARTKLKQTEVDCEYLKTCCETLTEENKRLQKELQELRALKTSQPFYMQLPATTLTMCPSCERVVTTSSTTTTPPNTTATKQQQPTNP